MAWAGTAGLALALTGALGAGAATGAPAATPPAPAPALTWGACEEGTPDGFECATLPVPLDYAHPELATVPLALIRLPAQANRVGAILLNPGGPGGSGFDFAANAAEAIDQEFGLDRRFDIVGFDPRGVQRSGAIDCVDDATIDATVYLDDTPDTPAEQQALANVDPQFAAACHAHYDDTLRFYSTTNTARDMDEIRRALGDEQISYIGVSYGTYLGGIYARLFPERVRAMVLDGAFEPSGDSEFDQWATQPIGFEHAFGNWAAWCQQNTDCEFTAPDVGARWDALQAQLDATPLTADDGREVNQVVLDAATTAAMYSKSTWAALGAALADAERGDGNALLALADSENGRNPDGTYDSLYQSFPVIGCASGFGTPYPADPEAMLAQIKAAAPRFARNMTVNDFHDNCSYLFNGPQKVYAPSFSGTAPILVVGGVNDPATPIRWAEELTAELGRSATMVTYTGEGHGAILDSTCVDGVESATIRELSLPPAGTTCAPDPDVPRPAYWDQLPVPDGVGAPIDDPGLDAALGLSPSQAYSGAWALTGDAATVAAAYKDALPALGLQTFDPVESNGALVVPASASDGSYLAVVDLLRRRAGERRDAGRGAAVRARRPGPRARARVPASELAPLGPASS